MRRLIAPVFLGMLAVPAALPSPASAWGDVGHRIVCEIAFREAGPATRARVRDLLALDAEFDRFADACTWPDHPRRRGPEHFVNLPRDAAGLEAGAVCPVDAPCLVSAVAADATALADPSSDDAARLKALKFLGHWVGDVHQPLHASFKDDRGGNGVAASGPCRGDNLHAVWDTCLVARELGLPEQPGRVSADDVSSAAAALLVEIADADRAAWTATGPVAWANESFALARASTVEYCVLEAGACRYEAGNATLDDGEPEKTVVVDARYVDDNAPAARERLKRAGVRLARLLDDALGR